MANIRVKDLPNTDTLADADELIVDSSSAGTRRVSYSELKTEVAADYVAAPTTYKVAPLNSSNKIDATYLPTTGDTAKGSWNASTNTPTLANGSGSAGDYYDVTTGGVSLGISFSVGDVVKYDGANWFKIDAVANIFDGISTVDQVKTLAQVPDTGAEPNQSPLNLHLGSMAYQDSTAPSVGTLHSDGLARMSNTGGDVALWAESTNANVMIVNVVGASPNYIFDVRDDDVSKFRIDGNGNVVIGNIPTSATGLASGTVYSVGGTLKIV